MKKITATFIVLFICLAGFSQRPAYFDVGLTGHFLSQPGLSIAYQLELKEWEKSEIKKRSLFIRPGVSIFSRINYNTNIVAGSEIGIKMAKTDKNFYSSFGLGGNYLLQSEVLFTTVNLQGEVVSKKREPRHYFLPMLSYRFGWEFSNGIGWYSRFSGGMKLSPSYSNILMLFGEVGLNFKIN